MHNYLTKPRPVKNINYYLIDLHFEEPKIFSLTISLSTGLPKKIPRKNSPKMNIIGYRQSQAKLYLIRTPTKKKKINQFLQINFTHMTQQVSNK